MTPDQVHEIPPQDKGKQAHCFEMPGNVAGTMYAFGCPSREKMLEWVEVIHNYGKELRSAFDYLKTATPLPQIIDQEMPRTCTIP